MAEFQVLLKKQSFSCHKNREKQPMNDQDDETNHEFARTFQSQHKEDYNLVKEWLFRCNQFFDIDQTPESMKIKLVTMYLKGRALQWHQAITKDMDGSLMD